MDGMLVATRKPPTDAIVCSGVLDSQVGGKVLVQRILEESVLVNRIEIWREKRQKYAVCRLDLVFWQISTFLENFVAFVYGL